jgi:hypothetical protein
MPADLAKQFCVRETGDRGKTPKIKEGVKISSKPGRRGERQPISRADEPSGNRSEMIPIAVPTTR